MSPYAALIEHALEYCALIIQSGSGRCRDFSSEFAAEIQKNALTLHEVRMPAGYSLWMQAATAGAEHLFSRLCALNEKWDRDERDVEGNSYLQIAYNFNKPKMASLILEAGSNGSLHINAFGSDALFRSALTWEQLTSKYSFKIVFPKDRKTPVDYFPLHGLVMREKLKMRALPKEKHSAALEGFQRTFEQTLSELPPSTVYSRNEQGLTVFDLAVFWGLAPLIPYFLTFEKAAEFLEPGLTFDPITVSACAFPYSLDFCEPFMIDKWTMPDYDGYRCIAQFVKENQLEVNLSARLATLKGFYIHGGISLTPAQNKETYERKIKGKISEGAIIKEAIDKLNKAVSGAEEPPFELSKPAEPSPGFTPAKSMNEGNLFMFYLQEQCCDQGILEKKRHTLK